MENEVLDYVMETPGNTNPAILGQMLDANSGTKLPEPTSEDNGKVLGVSNGSYALVNGGGGGGAEPLIITNEIPSGGLNNVLDKTYEEITSHIANGGQVIVKTITGTDEDGQESYDYIVHYGMAYFVDDGVTITMYEVATKDAIWGSTTIDGILAQAN